MSQNQIEGMRKSVNVGMEFEVRECQTILNETLLSYFLTKIQYFGNHIQIPTTTMTTITTLITSNITTTTTTI